MRYFLHNDKNILRSEAALMGERHVCIEIADRGSPRCLSLRYDSTNGTPR